MIVLTAWLTTMIGTAITNHLMVQKIKRTIVKKGYTGNINVNYEWSTLYYLLGPIGLGIAIKNYCECEQLVEQLLAKQKDQEGNKKVHTSSLELTVLNQTNEEEKNNTDVDIPILVLEHRDQHTDGKILYFIQNDSPIIVKSAGAFDEIGRKQQYDMINNAYQQMKERTTTALKGIGIGELLEPSKPIYDARYLLEQEKCVVIPEQYFTNEFLIECLQATDILGDTKSPKTYQK